MHNISAKLFAFAFAALLSLPAQSTTSRAVTWQSDNQRHVTIKGIVFSETAAPMPGSYVREVGNDKNGTVTDKDGMFTLQMREGGSFEVSSLGYVTQTVALERGKVSYVVNMDVDTKLLDEVVVIGYGSVKKSDLTYSISKITDDAIKERPLTMVGEAFQGTLSGVRAQAQDGVPGEEMTIRIRGTNTINGDSSPLYVIDGIPQDGMMELAAGDIASIQILKDAAATSIYGARGGNGVVLIETKVGESQEPTVTFNAYYGIQNKEKKLDMMSGEEWIAYNMYRRNLAYKRSGGSLQTPMSERSAAYQIPDSWYTWDKFTDWQDEIFQNAPIQEYTVSASQKTKKSNTYLSAGYMRQDGVVITTYYEKRNARIKHSMNINKRLTVGVNFHASKSNQNGANASGKEAALHHALMCSPLMQLDEGTRDTGFPVNVGQTYPNPVLRVKSTKVTTRETYLGMAIWGEYKILNGLKFKTQYSEDYTAKVYEFFQPGNVAYNNGYKTIGNSWSSTGNKWVLQNTLTWDKKFKSGHSINAVAGQSAESYNYYKITAEADNFPYETVRTLNVATTPITAITNRNARTGMSFFTRAVYNYKSRYLLTASVRYDGSSRFGYNTKWGLFPSASAGWKISEEPFMKSAGFISLLKLRASWGCAGNDRIGDYSYISKLATDNASFGNTVVSGVAAANIANPDLQWERTTSVDLGLDWSMFQNKVQLNLDWYVNTTDNLLFNVTIPYSTGFSSFTDNVGKVRNSGWEIDLTTHNLSGELKWSTTLNLSRNSNKVLDLGDITQFTTTSYDAIFLTQVGKPISQFYCYKTDGVLTADDFGPDGESLVPVMTGQREGNPKYVDINNDGQITDADYTVCGNNLPDLIFGMTNTFSWKGLSLSILLQGQAGGEVMFLGARQYDVGKTEANQFAHWVHCYKPDFDAMYGEGENPIPYDYLQSHKIDMNWDGKTANVAYGVYVNNDDRRIFDASYFRIKNITVGYDLPKKLLKKSRIKGAHIYLSADNVRTFSDYIGYNVEGNSFGNNTTMQGVDYSSYPLSRRIVFGGSINF